MIKKVKTIIFSRFKKPNLESFVRERRNQCNKCKFNSKNNDSISLKMRLINFFSELLTFFTVAKEVQDLGQCVHPKCGCNIYFKTQEDTEVCPINKWKR